MSLESIHKPTIIVDEQICKDNILRMLNKAYASGATLRPHFKTHQNSKIGAWFKEVGVSKIAVSSVSMASQFANDGWNDIMIAFPFNVREADEINTLAQNVRLGLIVSCIECAELLAKSITTEVDYYLKIDVGSHRTGFDAKDSIGISNSIEIINENKLLFFKGFVAHAGHTYNAANHDEIRSIYRIGVSELFKLKSQFIEKYPDIIISWGDTPSCSIVDDFSGIEELRPGNFVFYDLMQLKLGSCLIDNISAVVACPVVAKNFSRNEIVIYGGAVHFSKESTVCDDGINHYGIIVDLNSNGKWSFVKEKFFLRKISQEHGIITANDEFLQKIAVGDLIGVLPVHSCLTANLIRDFYFV
jgi:D-serine deaminase-like pyridoxal phosphate-dependent protein